MGIHDAGLLLVATSAADARPVDWAGLAIGVLGIVLTIGGFWLALVQISRTKSAANAARDASVVGTMRIRYNQLIILVPQLQNLEPEMDSAVRQNDPYAAERVLVRWRQVATQALGILDDMGDEHSELTVAIEKTCGTAITAKAKLSGTDSDKSVAELTAGVRKELAAVTDRLGALLGVLATQVSGDKT